MKARKGLVGLHWVVVILVATFFLSGVGQAAAQEIKGYIITKDGALVPDQAPPVASGGEDYFIQRNADKAVRDLNDFHQLGLTESEIEELAERLETEVYPRYPGPIRDLKAYVMDVNNTLGLGLTEEQVDMQVGEALRPERPEEFEIPLRPPETLNEVIERTPADESAPYFIGDNCLLMFYVDDQDTSNAWTDSQKLIARDRVVESYNWFLAKDSFNYISSVFYARDPASFEVDFTNHCDNTWMDQIAIMKGYTDLEDCLRTLKSAYGVDYIVALFLISEDSRSQACPYIPEWDAGRYGHWDERAIIFAYKGSGAALVMRDAGVYKHEALHLYGACDEYYSSMCNSGCGQCVATYPDFRAAFLNQHNCEYCTTTPVSCVMRSGAHADPLNNDICTWTMGQIGWVCPASLAAANSSVEPYVPLLREFRDRYLLRDNNPIGRMVVRYYYRFAPEMVDLMARHEPVKKMMRAGLAPLAVVSAIFIKTTSVQKLLIAMSLVLLSSATVVTWRRRKIHKRKE